MASDDTYYICKVCTDDVPGYIELTVSTIGNDGTMYFTDSDRVEYEFSQERWRLISENDLSIAKGDAPASTDALWGILDDLETRHANSSDPWVKEHLETAGKRAFNALYEVAQ